MAARKAIETEGEICLFVFVLDTRTRQLAENYGICENIE